MAPPARPLLKHLLFQGFDIAGRNGAASSPPQEGPNLVLLSIMIDCNEQTMKKPLERFSRTAVSEPLAEHGRARLRLEKQSSGRVEPEDMAMEEMEVSQIRLG